MAQVETVRGTIDSGALGQTLMHEHIFVLSPEINRDFPELSWEGEKETKIKEAIEKLREVKSRGFDTVVDLTVHGLGRFVPNVQRVNAEVDINIVVATGMYTYDELPHFLASRQPVSGDANADLMTDMFVTDITKQIGETGVRAGVLKCCTEEQGVTPSIDRVLRAVAQAHRQTGVPISTHSNAERQTGRDQQRVFAEEGVDLSRVVIGHSGDTTDLVYLRELMDRGSVIGMDRFGLYRPGRLTLDERVDTVARLCEAGYADRMVLSHDAMCHIDWFDRRRASLPDWVFTHVPDVVVPALRTRGVPEDQITQMLVGNPRRIFEQQGSY
jgi:phosphotriesterase-related protein